MEIVQVFLVTIVPAFAIVAAGLYIGNRSKGRPRHH